MSGARSDGQEEALAVRVVRWGAGGLGGKGNGVTECPWKRSWTRVSGGDAVHRIQWNKSSLTAMEVGATALIQVKS